MKEKSILIDVPHFGANEDKAVLVDRVYKEGDRVSPGDILCDLETTKTTFEIESQNDGYISYLAEIGEEVKTGQSIILLVKEVSDLEIEKKKIISTVDSLINPDKESVDNATKKAKALAKKFNIDLKKIKVKGVIKESDVQNLVSASVSKKQNNLQSSMISDEIKLIGNRKIAKELMLKSNDTIPSSYVEREVDVTQLVDDLRVCSEQNKILITFLSVVIYGLAKSLDKNRIFNSSRNGDSIQLYEEINIGVVININNVLSVPVIKNCNKLSPYEITLEILRLHKALIQKKANVDDLTGGTFTVTSMDHTEVTRFIPIIHPGQSGVLAIPSIQKKTIIDNSDFLNKQYANLGLSFDHSFLDAMQANNLLEDLIGNFIKIKFL